MYLKNTLTAKFQLNSKCLNSSKNSSSPPKRAPDMLSNQLEFPSARQIAPNDNTPRQVQPAGVLAALEHGAKIVGVKLDTHRRQTVGRGWAQARREAAPGRRRDVQRTDLAHADLKDALQLGTQGGRHVGLVQLVNETRQVLDGVHFDLLGCMGHVIYFLWYMKNLGGISG